MVAFYVMKIKDGTITIENVPQRWRFEVEMQLQQEEGSTV